MPTVITHAAVPLSGLRHGNQSDSSRLLFAGIVLAMLPDADVLAFARRRVRQCFRPSRLYPLPAVRLCGADTLRADWTTVVPGQPDAVLAVFNRVIAIAQPAGFDYHGRERRRLAVAVVR